MCVWHVQGDLQGLPPQYKITPKDDKHRRNPSLPLLTLSNTIQPPYNPPPTSKQPPAPSKLFAQEHKHPFEGRTKDFWQKSAKQIGNWGSDFSDQLEWLGFREQFTRKNLFDIFFG